MEVLLVSANREKSPYPVFPLGLSYLAGSLLAAGHRLRTIDLCFADDPELLLRAELSTFPPDAVIFSIRNIDNVTYPGSRSYLEGVKTAVAACRGKYPVILGGSGFSLMPRELLDFFGGDYGVVGEGEEILTRLLARLVTGESPQGLPGVLVKGVADYLPSVPVEKIGKPERSLFQVERYNRLKAAWRICRPSGAVRFACIYCTYPILEGKPDCRLRDVDAHPRRDPRAGGVNTACEVPVFRRRHLQLPDGLSRSSSAGAMIAAGLSGQLVGLYQSELHQPGADGGHGRGRL
jgi:radical SAM superfamily enzyme YgiQ (UPF0313 family)